jgi:hypothetical protein
MTQCRHGEHTLLPSHSSEFILISQTLLASAIVSASMTSSQSEVVYTYEWNHSLSSFTLFSSARFYIFRRKKVFELGHSFDGFV